MSKYECSTHKVSVKIDGNTRQFETPKGSWAGMPQCQLLLMSSPTEGKFKTCVIRKVA